MFVKQLSVFIENKPGKLSRFTKLLCDEKIDLLALSIADTTKFGILRAVVGDYQRAYDCIKQSGYPVNLTDVIAVKIPDEPGGLANVLEVLFESGISMEYVYTFVRRVETDAIIILKLDNQQEGAKILQAKGINILSQEEL